MAVKDRRDSAYSWVVVIASLMCNGINIAIILGPTLFLVNLTDTFGLTTAQVGLMIGVNTFVTAAGGLPTGLLIDMFGSKIVGLIGCILTTVSYIAVSLSTNIWLFFVWFTAAGVFHALTILPPRVIVQHHFNKLRPLATGISMTGFSIGIFTLMPLLAYVNEQYGWRGAFQIIAGFSLFMCQLMLLFSPVKAPEEKTDKNTSKSNKIWDWRFFLNPTVILVAVSFALFDFGADMMCKMSSTRAELDFGMDKIHASSIVSFVAIGSIISRCISSFVANIPWVNVVGMYSGGIIVGSLFIIASVFAQDFIYLLITAFCYGNMFGLTNTVQMTVLVELLGVDKFAQASGLVRTATGLAHVCTVPFGGWIYYVFGSFRIAYLTAGVIQFIGGIIAFILFLQTIQLHKNKSKPDIENAEDTTSLQLHEKTPLLNNTSTGIKAN